MEPPPRRYPGMTTRIAKAAYRKRGGSHITEIEQRQILRGAELAERAAKIKEKERNKKINKKKREEKEAKEKERKKTCGIEGGLGLQNKWKSSQRGIGDFLEKGRVDDKIEKGVTSPGRAAVQHNTIVTRIQDNRDAAALTAYDESQASIIRVQRCSPRLPSDRGPLQATSPNSVRLRPQRLQAETKGYDCLKVWDDDWTALVPSNAQIARELNSPEVDDSRKHELSMRQPSCTNHNTSQIVPKDLPCPAIRTSALLPPYPDQGIPFISTQDLRFLEEDLEEIKTPKLKRKATGPLTALSPNRLTGKDKQRPTKRIKSSLPPKVSHASAPGNEQLPQPAMLSNNGTPLQLKEIPVPAATQYSLISTQDLLELDLGFTEPSPARPRHPQMSQTSFSFGEEEITDEDLLGLDIPG